MYLHYPNPRAYVKSFLTSLFLFAYGLTPGQSISGSVTDAKQLPVPYCVVALLHSGDSALVQGKITDENGVYVFEPVKSGNYFIKVSAMGFEPVFSSAISKDSLTDLQVPAISLSSAKLMDEVVIASLTPTIEFKNGNIIINIENSPLARGNSVYDLLFKLPGVSIENNTITIQGKSGVIVMIDGRVQHLSNEQIINQLKGMSAATVQKIEVLKNPPVKYDAAGTSGMINIVTKRSQQVGFSGSAYTETSQGFYNNTSSGIALNYKNEKISIFSSIDGSYNTYLVHVGNSRNIQTDSGNTNLDNKNRYKILENEFTVKLGADWFVNRSNVIGFKIDGGPGLYNEYGKGLNIISGYNNTGFDNYFFTEDGHNKWNILNYNINAEHHFDTTGTVLSFSADYTDLAETDKSIYENHFYDKDENEILVPNIFQNQNKSATGIFSSKLDFIHPLDTTSSIEAGMKGSNAIITNEFLFEREDIASSSFYTDTALSTLYRYTEQNLAAYFNYSRSFKHLNMQLGIRGENTAVTGSTGSYQFSKNYFSLFPNLSFEYSKSDDHVFQLNLNRRFDRPGFGQLNPFIVYLDQYSYFRGNPFLQPAYSNAAELTYSFKGIINNSISFSHITDCISDITEQIDSTKILLTDSRNIDFNNDISYLLFVKYSLASWYEITFNGNISYQDYKGEISGVAFRTQGLAYNANLSNTFLLPKEIKLEISALYRGPNIFGIVNIDPVWSASFAIQKSFFKDHLDCTIGMHDVFNTFRFHTNSHFSNQDWNFYQSSDTRRISLSVSYNFGRAKAEEREMNSNEQEKERLGK
jgi:outer membrane cobalamin receptor